MDALTQCTGCARLIRREDDCPFCGVKRRSSRRRLLATGLLLGGLVACGEDVPVYGIPPVDDANSMDSGVNDSAVNDAMHIDIPILPPYGRPPLDMDVSDAIPDGETILPPGK